MNVLSSLLIKCQEVGSLKGIKISQKAPPINHLIYADDILLFLKAYTSSINKFKTIFASFGSVLDLSINPTKSEISFTLNISNR